ncbi:MAG: HAMP domain-containing histidine kinase [Lachnospiraceae bacterium]|nr:HAMP domain-containing histidine kinase [Lachnospiraceae bacterium]
MERVKQNELGQLCQSFEDMRQALYENNQKLWRTLEERKRLNAAFSHDIRTPLAVLKGYQEMMETYVPEGRFSEERLMEMIETMGKQITRLENYTQKMTQVQKLEDIVPEPENVKVKELAAQCQEAGKLLAGELMLELRTEELCRNIQEMPKKGMDQDVWDDQECGMTEEWSIDRELFLEVFENLVSNAVRFAKEKIMVTLCRKGTADVGDSGEEAAGRYLCLVVEDDGPGFSEEALERGMEPFFGSEKDGRVHFGLGLHICKVICEKHGGKLWLENGASGGRVSACFGDLDKRKADSLEK